MLIDSHCHLDFECFDHDRIAVLNKCCNLSIHTIVVPGTQTSRWQNQISLCQQHSQLRFALGLHPYFLGSFELNHLDKLTQLLEVHADKVLAVGEIGLDSHIDVNWQQQVYVFERQLQLASDFDLPVILHHRKSHNELIRTLKKFAFKRGGIVHAFSGSVQEAMSYIELGFKLGVGGVITYPRANKTRSTISQLPLSSLVLETDAPDMPVQGKQGQRNSPEYLPVILDSLSSIRQECKQELLQACTHNVQTSLANL